MGIGYRIKEARENLGLTQIELGKLAGVTGSAITNYEKETSHPKEQIIYKLMEVLGVDANYLFQDCVNLPRKTNDVTLAEYEHIKKYRSLDPHGRETVDWILDRESIRVSELQEKSNRISELESPAMQADTNICRFRTINYYYRLASAGTGQIVFGTPPTKRIEIPDIPQYRKADYAIGVNGNSMEPVFSDGDMLLVEMADEIDPGEIGIFLVDNESYVKKLGHGELISLNPKAANIPLTENSKCMGRVLGTLGKG